MHAEPAAAKPDKSHPNANESKRITRLITQGVKENMASQPLERIRPKRLTLSHNYHEGQARDSSHLDNDSTEL